MRMVRAVIDEHGELRLLEPVELPAARQALVTILDEAPDQQMSETAILSEAALSENWNRPEEDEAWSYLQPTG
jgi:hypothetical protein